MTEEEAKAELIRKADRVFHPSNDAWKLAGEIIEAVPQIRVFDEHERQEVQEQIATMLSARPAADVAWRDGIEAAANVTVPPFSYRGLSKSGCAAWAIMEMRKAIRKLLPTEPCVVCDGTGTDLEHDETDCDACGGTGVVSAAPHPAKMEARR